MISLNLKKLNEKQLLVYTAVIAFVICLIPFGFWCNYQHITGNGFLKNIIANPDSYKAQIEKADENIATNQAIVSKRPTLLAKLEELSNNKTKYEKTLPKEQDVEELYRTIGGQSPKGLEI